MSAPIIRLGTVLVLLLFSLLAMQRALTQNQGSLRSASLTTVDCAQAVPGRPLLSPAKLAANSSESLIRAGAMGGRGQPQPAALGEASIVCAEP